MADFETKLKERLKERYNPLEPRPEDNKDVAMPTHKPYQPVDSQDEPALPELAEAHEIQDEAFDCYISSRVRVPQGDDWAYGTVKRCKQNADCNLVGHANKNPLLDTSIYKVKLDDGEREAFSANIIAEHIYSQVNQEGFTHYTLSEIIDHKRDSLAVTKDDGFVTTPNGQKKPRMTTVTL